MSGVGRTQRGKRLGAESLPNWERRHEAPVRAARRSRNRVRRRGLRRGCSHRAHARLKPTEVDGRAGKTGHFDCDATARALDNGPQCEGYFAQT